jgi:hypothetical protein
MPRRGPLVVPGVTDEDPNTGRRIKKKTKKVPAALGAAARAVSKLRPKSVAKSTRRSK